MRLHNSIGNVNLNAAKNPQSGTRGFFPFVPQGYGSRAQNDIMNFR